MDRAWSFRPALAMALAAVLGGSATVAQTEPAAPVEGATQVTGTSTLVGELRSGERTEEAGVMRIRDSVLVTVEDATDPRVTGRATITLNVDVYPGAEGTPVVSQIRFGEMRLENERGAWEGAFGGRLSHDGFTQTYWLSGEGDFAGLSYVVTAGGSGPVWRSQGIIYPGEVPPLGGQTLPRLERLGPGAPVARTTAH